MRVELPDVFDAERESSRFLAQIKRRAAKSFSWTRVQPLWDAMALGYWLHVFGEDGQALDVCRFLSQCESAGNYRLWDSIERSLALRARLLRFRGGADEAAACVERMRSTGFLPTRLGGSVLTGYEENVRAVMKEAVASVPREKGWRMMALGELYILIELGGSPALPVALLEERASENIARLRELVGLPRTSPA